MPELTWSQIRWLRWLRNDMRPSIGVMVTKNDRALTWWPIMVFQNGFHRYSDASIISVRSFQPIDYFRSLRVDVLVIYWRRWSSGALRVINTFSTLFEVFAQLVNIFLRHGEVLPQHPCCFRTQNFNPQTKFPQKNRKINSWSFGKRKPKYITNNPIDTKFGTKYWAREG